MRGRREEQTKQADNGTWKWEKSLHGSFRRTTKIDDELNQIRDILDTSPNTRKAPTTIYIHYEESISPFSHPTMQASESDVALEMADRLKTKLKTN